MNLFWKIFLSLFVGFFLLFWLHKNIDIHKLISMSQSIDMRYVILGVLFYTCALSIRAFRWKKILHTNHRFRQILPILISGYAMNVILPARLGEFFRANLCKTWLSISRSHAFASIVVERIADGITVLLCLMIGLLSLSTLVHRTEILTMLVGGSCLFGSAVLILLFSRKWRLPSFLQKIPRLQSKILSLQAGFRDIPSTLGWKLIPISLIVWIFEGLSLWAIVKSTGCDLDIFAAALLVGAVSLSTLLPSPPGFLGTMQFAFAMALQSVGYSIESGVLAATLTQIFLIGSLTVSGVVLYAWVTVKNKAKEKKA